MPGKLVSRWAIRYSLGYRSLRVPLLPDLQGISHNRIALFASGRSFAPTPREVLGVGWQCTEAEVKAAFRQQAKLLHPDMNPKDKEAAAERFHELESAYAAVLAELRGGTSPGDEQFARKANVSDPGSARTWQELRNAAPNVAAKPWWPELDKIGSSLLWVALGVGACACLANMYFARSDRLQEEADRAEFGVKRARLRQEAAEKRNRELEEELARRSQKRVVAISVEGAG